MQKVTKAVIAVALTNDTQLSTEEKDEMLCFLNAGQIPILISEAKCAEMLQISRGQICNKRKNKELKLTVYSFPELGKPILYDKREVIKLIKRSKIK